VLDVVPDIPVVAAGGIGTGRAMAAALAAGADGVRVGTCFAASVEADLHPIYADALIAARAEDSVYGRAYQVGCT
jgi:NAD(P)H-dependent flavin oxidoreductase YrpB (nitropropane dioxygenase family)